ncbi:MAG: HDIG domain-containing protein [Pyrinomonadaceae bacterium]|nr:HDIG domain-containing protein [Pyrinomonadaceae bacterium]
MSRRRPRFSISLSTLARDAAARVVFRPFNWFSPTTRLLIGFGVLTFVTTLLLAKFNTRMPAEIYKEGDIVRANVVAPADVNGIDMGETKRRRDTVIANVPTIWNYDAALAETQAQKLRASWNALQQEDRERRNDARAAAKSGEIASALAPHLSDQNTLDRLMRALREVNASYIYDEGDAQHIRRVVRIIDERNNAQPVIATEQDRLIPISTARQNLRTRISTLAGWKPQEQEALASLMLPLVGANVTFDQAATERAYEEAAATISPGIISLKRNQVVAREGDTVTEQMLTQFASLRDYGRTERRPHHVIGLFILVGALYWAAWKFTTHRTATSVMTLTEGKAFALIGSAVVMQTILMRIGFTVADSIATHSLRPPLNDPTVWGFAVPFAAAALLVALLVDAQLALIAGVITALFAGLLAPNGMLMSFYAMISASAAIYGIGRYKERQSVTLAGLVVAGVNALIALAVILSAQQPLTLNSFLLAAGCGIAGGLLTIIFTAGGLPINEAVFDILTDVKLLELSNADLPVLGQLALRAPGTNQHSHAVGQLAEDGCRAIGANALLARIGALYHDIGKLAAPEMFVENQNGSNPHDRLRPAQSARIVISHVTYGLKLAKQLGLPRQISDFIPQHHGTRTLHFFLRLAQGEAHPGETVNEEDFRYPGPKPQSKEGAVMMLADSCEAATRSLAHPDPENIRLIVSKIFDSVLSDGQLDECEISFRELRLIRKTLIASLISIHHGRVDYPGYNPPPLTGALQALPATNGKENHATYTNASEVPISKGGEVEDEAVIR